MHSTKIIKSDLCCENFYVIKLLALCRICNKQQNIFFMQVESRGDILFLRSVQPKSETVLQNSNTIVIDDTDVSAATNTVVQTKSWRLMLRIVPEMAPSSRIIIYYIRFDGEVVATSMPLLVDNCFPNKVICKISKKHRLSLPTLYPLFILSRFHIYF